jgi:hypothetical protein
VSRWRASLNFADLSLDRFSVMVATASMIASGALEGAPERGVDGAIGLGQMPWMILVRSAPKRTLQIRIAGAIGHLHEVAINAVVALAAGE